MKLFPINKSRIENLILIVFAAVLFLNIIIFLLIFKFLKTEELQLIVTSITGIIPLLILYWALSESKRNNSIMLHQNKIMMSEPIYAAFIQEIDKRKEGGDIYMFSDEENRILENDFSLSIKGLQLKHFPTALSSLLNPIFENPVYHKYVPLVEGSGEVIVAEADLIEIKKIVMLMDMINYKISKTYNWHYLLEVSYKSIVESEFLVKQQKVQLFKKLDLICDDYMLLCKLNPMLFGDLKLIFHGKFDIYEIYRFDLHENENGSLIKVEGRITGNYCKSYEQIMKYWNTLNNLKE